LSNWKWQAKQVGRSLPAYTSTPSTGSSPPALVHTSLPKEASCGRLSLLGKGFELRCFQLLSLNSLAARRCLVRQPVRQRLRCPVPLVLGTASPQTTTASIR